MTVLHYAQATAGNGYVWTACPSRRRGGPTQAHRATDDPEQVTCLRCLDLLTRP